MLQSMESERVRHNWTTELNRTETQATTIFYHYFLQDQKPQTEFPTYNLYILQFIKLYHFSDKNFWFLPVHRTIPKFFSMAVDLYYVATVYFFNFIVYTSLFITL